MKKEKGEEFVLGRLTSPKRFPAVVFNMVLPRIQVLKFTYSGFISL